MFPTGTFLGIKKIMKKITLAVITVLCFGVGYAQNCPQGHQYYQNKNYKNALKSFEKCLKDHPEDSSLLLMKGMSLVKLKNYEKAKLWLQQAIDRNVKNMASAKFNLGLCILQSGQHQEALALMQESVALGFRRYTDMDTDEFAWVRGTEAFDKIRNQAYQNAFPCLKDPNNAKFDFWLGEWDVYTHGRKRAQSKITKPLGGCAVLEEYTTSSGLYAGQSISYYDPVDNIWHQYWVGSAGDKSRYYETSAYDADLQFLTKSPDENGKETWTKMSYTQEDENTVIQVLESSTDRGATWTEVFQGTYKRKTP